MARMPALLARVRRAPFGGVPDALGDATPPAGEFGAVALAAACIEQIRLVEVQVVAKGYYGPGKHRTSCRSVVH